MFTPQVLTTKIIVKPSEIKLLRRESFDLAKDELINSIILNKIKKEVGDRCVSSGYLEADSIEIIERTIGKIYAEHLNGDIIYNVRYSAKICNPIKGMELTAVVENINKMGIMAIAKPLTIVLARQHHVNRKCFKNIKVGDEISLTVIGSRFELNETEISVIGYLSDKYYDKDTESSGDEMDMSTLDESSIMEDKTTEGDSEFF